jgi:hypothetical protein
MNLPHGVTNSLDKKLNSAMDSIREKNYRAAVGQLNAFVDEVHAQTDEAITPSQAQTLTLDAQSIITSLSSITTTSLQCHPSTARVGATTRCDAKISSAGNVPLTGTPAFTSSDPQGTFGKVTCGGNGENDNGRIAADGQDDGNGGSILSCRVDYIPSVSGAQTVTATYPGDTSHLSSSATFVLKSEDAGDAGHSTHTLSYR